MKEKLIIYLKKIIDTLEKIHNKYAINKIDGNNFHSLAPTKNAENNEHYLNTISWALQNKDKIKNIAITGTYGSGKSSIIQTYLEQNKNTENHFLNISLATFNEEEVEKPIEKDKKPIEKDNVEIIRLIELSILQQILYHENDKNIPQSRFKRIKSVKKYSAPILSIAFLIFLFSLIRLFFPDFLVSTLKIPTLLISNKWLHFTSLIYMTGYLFYFGMKFFISINGISIKKFKIKETEIEIGENISKSILNSHIDEILYFFEATKYNVVIIEDLDRFRQTEIFTKLRELNLLINNSKKVKKDVVFIYAVRDDMFNDNERTKFFDFIIPIIPVINSSNSSGKLLEIIKDNNYQISTDLIEDISLFIDDMRLLYNILNEYYIYHNNLSLTLKLDPNKLLSMLVYKNIFPRDFTKLSNNDGFLYKAISKKHEYIKNEIDKNEIKILEIKGKIKTLELIGIKNIKDLRTLYISKIIDAIIISGNPFKNFYISGQPYNIAQVTDDNIFRNFISSYNKIEYIYTTSNALRTSIPSSFQNIEKEVDTNLSYQEKEDLIREYNNNSIETYKKQLEELDANIKLIKKQPISELIKNEVFKISENNDKQNDLIEILLRNGYIDEDYLDYISIFYEGTITKEDNQFLINVKCQKNTEFDFKLNKIDNLIKKINPLYFEKDFILNYSFLDFLLKSPMHNSELKNVFSILKNESNISIKFIDGFIEFTPNLEIFIKKLCEKWSNIWKYLNNYSSFTIEKKEKYFKLIVENADVNDIQIIFKDFELTHINNYNFSNVINDKSKLKKIISSLNIKFDKIDLNNTSSEIIDFIYENNYYKINQKMIETILKHKEKFNQIEFDTSNFSLIKKSDLSFLLKYIEANINEYLTNVFLKLERNNNEELEYFLELINNENISIENISKIVQNTQTLVENIEEVKSVEIENILYKESKIKPKWSNILFSYLRNENILGEYIISFINILENAKKLSTNKIETDKSNEKDVKSLCKDLLLEETIENNIYPYIIKSIPYRYYSLDFEILTSKKVQLLIINNILIITNENFIKLKENFVNLHILFLENNPVLVSSQITKFEFGEFDILALLKSTKFNSKQKQVIIEHYNVSNTIENISILKELGVLLLEKKPIELDIELILKVLIESDLDDFRKIQIFNKHYQNIDNNEITEILNTLNDSFSNITIKGKRPLISNNKEFLDFVNILKNKKYISKFDIELKGIRISTFRY